ncbi:MAG TPA: phosphoribosylaminoimidazole carboxylase, partial [Candidatus Thermoplasmatota archaeon]|nr:phosphoribosylaminoimidazole carboxylase [Candidatus Thermoplasmatota archaeon]
MAAKGKAPSTRVARAVRRLQAGRLSVEAFLEEVAPYAVHEVEGLAKLDGGRHARTGVAEAVLAEGKDDDTLAKVVRAAVRHRGRALITRLAPARARRLERTLKGVTFEFHARARVGVAHDGKTPRPRSGGKVAILTAGSTDLGVAEEARLAAEEQG